uniref:Uncharacterized protein n=1 Tax=Pseudomonas phage HRDY3 TaxID=3236930 RepID=A0AB39CEM7_9VIRU
MTNLSSRLAAYKYYKSLGKFTEDLLDLFGTPRTKPHYIQLDMGDCRLWMRPLGAERYHERRVVEMEAFGKFVKLPGVPEQPRIIASFALHEKHEGRIGAFNKTVKICGHPFHPRHFQVHRGHGGEENIVEFEWIQEGFGYSSHVQQREECRRIQHNFRPQAVFGTPEFESEKYKWQDRHNWSPRNRKRPIKLSYEVDLQYDYDYDADEYE